MKTIEDFFLDIDNRWKPLNGKKVVLRIIGCAALLLQSDYMRGTKDSDILETQYTTGTVKKNLLGLAGPGTDIHKRHRMYIEFVKDPIPFLPQKPFYKSTTDLNKELKHFRIEVLDIVDVVVTKLKTFRPRDVDDIHAMAEMGFVTKDNLVNRFNAAKDWWLMDARSEDLPRYIDNLHTVERDILCTSETPVDLPDDLG